MSMLMELMVLSVMQDVMLAASLSWYYPWLHRHPVVGRGGGDGEVLDES